MNLRYIFWPWGVIAELEQELADEQRICMAAIRQADQLRAQLSKFDHDNDGRVGGSRAKLKAVK